MKEKIKKALTILGFSSMLFTAILTMYYWWGAFFNNYEIEVQVNESGNGYILLPLMIISFSFSILFLTKELFHLHKGQKANMKTVSRMMVAMVVSICSIQFSYSWLHTFNGGYESMIVHISDKVELIPEFLIFIAFAIATAIFIKTNISKRGTQT